MTPVATQSTSRCIVCNEALKATRVAWVSRCARCRYLRSSLPDKINRVSTNLKVETEIEDSLLDLRSFDTFEELARLTNSTGVRGKSILDIGPGSGNFLARCTDAGMETFGVEPDEILANALKTRKFDVLQGYYPLKRFDRKFDFITLNDVLEHCPSITEVLEGCRSDLKDDGILLITIPNSAGVLYRIASQLSHVGWSEPFRRLWQTEFASPHVHYFNSSNFVSVMESSGWRELASFDYPAFTKRKLWERISAGQDRTLYNLSLYCMVRLALPALSVLPKDFSAHFFSKKAVN